MMQYDKSFLYVHISVRVVAFLCYSFLITKDVIFVSFIILSRRIWFSINVTISYILYYALTRTVLLSQVLYINIRFLSIAWKQYLVSSMAATWEPYSYHSSLYLHQLHFLKALHNFPCVCSWNCYHEGCPTIITILFGSAPFSSSSFTVSSPTIALVRAVLLHYPSH